jgi:anaerobic selenocysteine-containing dehydrogenase
MQSVITNAWRGDPYPIDTLMIFMANMAWNSTMNTVEIRKMLADKREDGEYRIPFLVVCDAFQSETTAFADLILPDTTYLERHDAMSMLDRPISEFDGPVDSVRIPVVPPTGECRPFQDVLIELGARIGLPAFTAQDGKPRYRDYTDFVVNFETAPGSGMGFLIGWRGKDGDKALVGEPNPRQLEEYASHDCFYHHVLPESWQYMRNCNGPYLKWAAQNGLRKFDTPIVIQLYSDVMQKFRLAAQGRRAGRQPPDHLRARVEHYFDPLPFWHQPVEHKAIDMQRFPLAAVTQRPMAMYHSWDSQNAWLRQIHGENYLFVNPKVAAEQGIADGGWMYIESQWGKVRCMARYSEAVEPGTVWTWNAIGKAAGAWNLGPQANESQRGFLLNHLITDELPPESGDVPLSNSDPVTGQAGWYDLRVRIYPAQAEEQTSLPQFAPMTPMPGSTGVVTRLAQAYFAGRGEFAARLRKAAGRGK